MKPAKTLLVGTRASSTQVSGLSSAFEMLIDGFQEKSLPYEVIDLGTQDAGKRDGTFNFTRGITVLSAVLHCWFRLLFVRQIYLTVALSTAGFFRDSLIIWPARFLNRTIILHIHSGGYGGFYQSQPRLIQGVIAATLRQANRIIILSERFKDQFSFLPDTQVNRKISVVFNGLPVRVAP